MAGQEELDKFVKKFVSLWQAGCDATLHVETTAGNAVVNLQVGLGQAKQACGGVSQNGASGDGMLGGGGRGGSPSRQRRRQRREAEREKEKAAEAVEGSVEKVDQETSTEEELVNEDKASDESANFLEYELKIDAHVDCKNYDLIEVIEVNFDGSLDDMKAEKGDVGRYIQVHKEHDHKDEIKCEGDRRILVYRVSIKKI